MKIKKNYVLRSQLLFFLNLSIYSVRLLLNNLRISNESNGPPHVARFPVCFFTPKHHECLNLCTFFFEQHV